MVEYKHFKNHSFNFNVLEVSWHFAFSFLFYFFIFWSMNAKNSLGNSSCNYLKMIQGDLNEKDLKFRPGFRIIVNNLEN